MLHADRYPPFWRIARYRAQRTWLRLQRLLRAERITGLLVLGAAGIGFACANSPLSDWYLAFRATRIGPEALHLNLSLEQWATDGLLAIFFFVVSLELKREFAAGALSRVQTAIVPVTAAAGGVVAPALIYLAFTGAHGDTRGWAIPTATDIAFAVAILGLIAPGIPHSLRVFLLTLAIVDDGIAIAIIAVFYAERIGPIPLMLAVAFVLFYALLARSRSHWYHRRSWAAWVTLLPIGVVVWGCVHAAGVHPTIAGVVLAFTVPVTGSPSRAPARRTVRPRASEQRLAAQFAHRFRPLSAGLAVPVFAFFAAGTPIGGHVPLFTDPIALGVICGLVIGKPLGITVTTLILTKYTTAAFAAELRPRELIGVAALAGVGFTVALLIAELSFEDPARAITARLAVMLGSLIAVAVAAVLLAPHRRKPSIYAQL